MGVMLVTLRPSVPCALGRRRAIVSRIRQRARGGIIGPVKAMLGAVVALALLGALVVGAQRAAWEAGTRHLELAIDLSDAQQLALEANEPLESFLAALWARGARALVTVGTYREAPLLGALDLAKLAELRQAGWALIWKLQPPDGRNQADFMSYLAQLARLAPQAYLPLSWGSFSPAEVEALRRTLERTNAALVLLEFHDQAPARALYRQGFTRFVRAHTISTAEQQRLGAQASLARWQRAVRERRIRLLYLHLPAEPLTAILAQLAALRRQLLSDGFPLGSFSPDAPPQVAWPLVALLLAGAGALLLLTLDGLRSLPQPALIGGGLGLLGLGLLGLSQQALLTRQAGAFIAAFSAPLVSFIALDRLLIGRTAGGRAGLLWVGGLALGALLGGLLCAALLSALPFYQELYLFRGVKLALIGPMVLSLIYYGLRRGRSVGPYTSRLRGLWQRPVRWGDLILLTGVGLALVVVILRSGNGSFLPASGLEQRTRALLESLFYARPRFKEFLIGYPALFLWAAWGEPRWGLAAWPLLALGLLAPVSLVNTYEHLHAPLLLSLARSGIGLGLGLVLGWTLWRVVLHLEARWPLRE